MGSKITADGDSSHAIKRCLLLGRKAMTNLDSILKSRDVTLPTKVRLVKAMVFPVVMYGCEKVKVKVVQLCLTLCDPRDYPVHGILQARILEWVDIPFSRGSSPNPGIKPRSPALQADSLPAEPQGKPKNTGVGSLSLLQRIFLTQKSNRGLLHCRRILYQLSYQGNPSMQWGI